MAATEATHSQAVASEFPYLPWRTVAEHNAVELREAGTGAPLVFVPGMTGGGQATLGLCVAGAARAAAAGRPYRLLLVDYTREAHATCEALSDTVEALLRPALGGEAAVIWAESLGCLVAAPLRLDAALAIRKRVMISPFAGVPSWKLAFALAGMAISPPPIYRRVMGPVGRWAFGPPGDQPRHVFYEAVARTPARVARRRSRWLKGRRFEAWFEAGSVPTKVWLGARDRIADIGRERAFFERLATERPGFELSIVERGGHVVTDTAALAHMLEEVTPWLVT